jgi:hypothetical protein
MEYRRRTVSAVMDDMEKQPPRRRGTSASIDEEIEQYSEYIYNGNFNICKTVFCGIKNLICCRIKNKSKPETNENSL